MVTYENHIQFHRLQHYVQHYFLPIDIGIEMISKKFDLLDIGKRYLLQMPINPRVYLSPSKKNSIKKIFYVKDFYLLHHPIEHPAQWQPLMDLERDGQ
jgi:hypothetical protein